MLSTEDMDIAWPEDEGDTTFIMKNIFLQP